MIFPLYDGTVPVKNKSLPLQNTMTAAAAAAVFQNRILPTRFRTGILLLLPFLLSCSFPSSGSLTSNLASKAELKTSISPELKNREIRNSVIHAARHPLVSRPVDLNRWDSKYDDYFRKYSKRFFGVGMDWRWFKAQAIAESELKHSSTGPRGAVGLMQIMPETFSQASNELLLDASQERWHIAVAIQYNRWLWNRWKGGLKNDQRIPFMLASYNAGRSRILRSMYFCGGCLRWDRLRFFVPPVTRHYLIKIYSLMGEDSES